MIVSILPPTRYVADFLPKPRPTSHKSELRREFAPAPIGRPDRPRQSGAGRDEDLRATLGTAYADYARRRNSLNQAVSDALEGLVLAPEVIRDVDSIPPRKAFPAQPAA